MKHSVIVGLQYGDEGKGKITDLYAKEANWVIRFNGGPNAGHTLYFENKKFVTHSVPSGILYPKCKNFIGAGCVIDPLAFAVELSELQAQDVNLEGRLLIHHRAQVIFPFHRALESLREQGSDKIGTTGRGIGPTYSLKVSRNGISVGDLFNKDTAEKRIQNIFKMRSDDLDSVGSDEAQIQTQYDVLKKARELFKNYLCLEDNFFYEVSKKEKCLLEGAQGALLDIDYGSYPYVTSSNTLASYAAIGAPFPMRKLGEVIGIAKVYMTRVGEGPFQTEILDEKEADALRVKGGEFGATTGRPRRVGWLNLDELKKAVQLNDCTGLVLTKADVLNDYGSIKLFQENKYVDFPIWDNCVGSDSKLHPKLESYIKHIENFVGIPVVMVGTGPNRKDVFER